MRHLAWRAEIQAEREKEHDRAAWWKVAWACWINAACHAGKKFSALPSDFNPTVPRERNLTEGERRRRFKEAAKAMPKTFEEFKRIHHAGRK